MTLDWLIVLVALSLAFTKTGAAVSVWLVVNILIIGIIDVYDEDYYWQSMALWAALFSFKDFLFLALSASLRLPLIITLSLFASCIFHQFLRFQIMTYTYSNLTLLEYRSTFMLFLSVIMLATAATQFISGGGNGGKRVKHLMPSLNNRLNNFFHLASREAFK